MTQPFAPADGDRARWRHLYDLVLTREPGDQVTIEEAVELLECSPTAAWSAMREAIRHLEEDGQRSARTVRRFGWVVMRPGEHLREIEGRTAKSRRAGQRGVRLVKATPRDELSQFERQALDRQGAQLAAQEQILGRRRKSFAEMEEASRQRKLPPSG